ncbi:MAG: transketolase [Alphaproteobacteria bacterium]|nr:transketolase [Alphaproteobacteria bacterium]
MAQDPLRDADTLHRMANAIRALSMDAVQAANSGHPGMPMGMADAATVLWTQFLKHDPANPRWHDRDRFVLSAGHGSMLLYSLLYLTGYEDCTLDALKQFRQLDAPTAGHPEYGHLAGIETTTGPLGQGLANAVGMAMAERHLRAEYGAGLVDHHIYAIAGDGCLMEGISHEAASLAGHQKLGRLIVLFDDNGICIDGPTSMTVGDDHTQRFLAYGWHVESVDGHDMAAVAAAIQAAKADARPSLIRCKTTIGFGAPTKAGTAATHGAPLGKDEIEGARKALGWPYAPFEMPADVLDAWRQTGQRGAADRTAWNGRLDASERKMEFLARMDGVVNASIDARIHEIKTAMRESGKGPATRAASQTVLETLADACPWMVGGSADLTGSNNTKAGVQGPMTPDNPAGRYVYWGVREHGMAAAMNGMALHGGVIPYGGTFLVFSDYNRPSIRLAALMGIRVIHVLTHDSIGLGEDGPTHQPVEHLAALRAIPNLLVMRPADAIETAECWQIALEHTHTPSAIALTRQNLPLLRTEADTVNRSRAGAYVLADAADGQPAVTLVASGSEVEIAMDARAALAADGIAARVVSMPCMELFAAQDEAERAAVLPPDVPVIAVEAAIGQGWDRWTGAAENFVGMTGFGASAPYKQLYERFGITAKAVTERAKRALGR